jgi:hypothetical protein
MRYLFAILVVTVFLMILIAWGATSASAHWAEFIPKNTPATTKINKAERNVHHGRTALTWLKKNPRGTYRSWKYQIRAHRFLHDYNLRMIDRWRYDVPPLHAPAWLCIHRYEKNPRQGWATNTGNGYYGGLQMDMSFMHSYAPFWLLRRGYAHVWTPYQQMNVAENAHRTRGFFPWPNTARACGLI